MKNIFCYKSVFSWLFYLVIVLAASSCKKFIEIDPPTDKASAEVVYANTDLAISAVTGIGTAISNSFEPYSSFSFQVGLLSDEFGVNIGNANLYLNTLTPGDLNVWEPAYRELIYRSNSAIEGITKSIAIPDQAKSKLIGETLFYRAFTYFYLVNLYGDVPLVLTTDIKANAVIARTDKSLVYAQIVKDLQQAQTMLSEDYLNVRLQADPNERVRPNSLAATALLARVYLYKGQWQNAQSESNKLINNSKYSLVGIDNVFLKNSKETIWAIQPNQIGIDGTNTTDGKVFVQPVFGTTFNGSVSDQLLSAFENGDLRKSNWLKAENSGSSQLYIPFKYKVGKSDATQPQSEYLITLRIAEQYLIRAEARAHLENIDGAKQDLNQIRRRAGLGDYSGPDDSNSLLISILKERQTEFFVEWGHRWFDLIRTNNINNVMSQVAPTKIAFGQSGTWASYKSLMPIPASEFQNNNALSGHQNPGYPEK